MGCLVKNKTKFIKQTCLDLWGKHMSYTKLTKAANFIRVIHDQSNKSYKYYKMDFIFTLSKRVNFSSKKSFKDSFLLPSLLFNFYLVLSRRNFMKLSNSAKKKKGYYMENYLGLLEGSLFMMVYSSNLMSNLFLMSHVIEHNMFWVNEKLSVHFNSMMKPGDFLWFADKQWEKMFKRDLLLSLYANVMLWPMPKYLAFNAKFMLLLFCSNPKFEEMVYPAGNMDIYLANEYHMI